LTTYKGKKSLKKKNLVSPFLEFLSKNAEKKRKKHTQMLLLNNKLKILTLLGYSN